LFTSCALLGFVRQIKERFIYYTFYLNTSPYQVIEPIESEEFSDIDMQLDTTIPKTNTPYLVPGSLLTAETLGDNSP